MAPHRQTGWHGRRPVAPEPTGGPDTLPGLSCSTSSSVSTRPSRGARAAWAALVVGLAYAAVSAYWAAGGTWLLDTVGGVFEHLAHSSSPVVLIGSWLVVLVKVVAAALPIVVVRELVPTSACRAARGLAWTAGAVLVAYGSVLTMSGLVIQAGVLQPGAHADGRALAWHAFLWDPWFLIWGLLVVAALYSPAANRRTHP